jgi:hypothetical protein
MISQDERDILLNLLWAERVIKKYPNIHNNILNFNKNFPIETPFKIKIYNYFNNIEYPIKCYACSNHVKFFNGSYSKFCSNKCSNKDKDLLGKRNETMMNRYGKLSMISNPDIKHKIKISFEKNHGVSNISELAKLPETKIKISKTKLSYSKDKRVIINTKRSTTNLDKWGVDNISKNKNIKKITKENNIKKWGIEYPIMLDVIKEKSKQTSLEKYGVNHISKNENFRKKYKITNDLNYNKYLENGTSLFNCDKGHTFSISSDIYNHRKLLYLKICTICNPLNNKYSSQHEEISNFLKELDIKHTINDRNIIPKELDIYIPEYNIAIEFNGLYWHSELYKDKKYHLNKTNMCNNLGIRLIHIFEDDWIYRKDICKSIILNSINKIENKIYARKCCIKEINDNKIVRSFLDKNHIQGFCSSSIKLGLFYNNELVSLMTFGYRGTNGKKEYELIRFCSLLNTSVIGGSSKLFKYFVNNYEYDELISYSDLSMFDGSLYEKLGFKYSHLSNPNYYWVVDGIRKHRFNYNKKKLIKHGYDPSKTENEIMHELGYYKIWGCGQKKWIY